MEQYDEALSDYDEAIKLAGNDALAVYYYNRGMALYNLDSLEAAVTSISEAIALDSLVSYYYTDRGDVLMDSDLHEEAIKDYSRAILLDHANAGLLIKRARARKSLNNMDDAIADCTEAIEVDSTYIKAYLVRGIIYVLMDQYEDAESDISKAFDLIKSENKEAVLAKLFLYADDNTEQAKVLNFFGRMAGSRGKYEQAIAIVEAAISLDSTKGEYFSNKCFYLNQLRKVQTGRYRML